MISLRVGAAAGLAPRLVGGLPWRASLCASASSATGRAALATGRPATPAQVAATATSAADPVLAAALAELRLASTALLPPAACVRVARAADAVAARTTALSHAQALSLLQVQGALLDNLRRRGGGGTEPPSDAAGGAEFGGTSVLLASVGHLACKTLMCAPADTSSGGSGRLPPAALLSVLRAFRECAPLPPALAHAALQRLSEPAAIGVMSLPELRALIGVFPDLVKGRAAALPAIAGAAAARVRELTTATTAAGSGEGTSTKRRPPPLLPHEDATALLELLKQLVWRKRPLGGLLDPAAPSLAAVVEARTAAVRALVAGRGSGGGSGSRSASAAVAGRPSASGTAAVGRLFLWSATGAPAALAPRPAAPTPTTAAGAASAATVATAAHDLLALSLTVAEVLVAQAALRHTALVAALVRALDAGVAAALTSLADASAPLPSPASLATLTKHLHRLCHRLCTLGALTLPPTAAAAAAAAAGGANTAAAGVPSQPHPADVVARAFLATFIASMDPPRARAHSGALLRARSPADCTLPADAGGRDPSSRLRLRVLASVVACSQLHLVHLGLLAVAAHNRGGGGASGFRAPALPAPVSQRLFDAALSLQVHTSRVQNLVFEAVAALGAQRGWRVRPRLEYATPLGIIADVAFTLPRGAPAGRDARGGVDDDDVAAADDAEAAEEEWEGHTPDSAPRKHRSTRVVFDPAALVSAAAARGGGLPPLWPPPAPGHPPALPSPCAGVVVEVDGPFHYAFDVAGRYVLRWEAARAQQQQLQQQASAVSGPAAAAQRRRQQPATDADGDADISALNDSVGLAAPDDDDVGGSGGVGTERSAAAAEPASQPPPPATPAPLASLADLFAQAGGGGSNGGGMVPSAAGALAAAGPSHSDGGSGSPSQPPLPLPQPLLPADLVPHPYSSYLRWLLRAFGWAVVDVPHSDHGGALVHARDGAARAAYVASRLAAAGVRDDMLR